MVLKLSLILKRAFLKRMLTVHIYFDAPDLTHLETPSRRKPTTMKNLTKLRFESKTFKIRSSYLLPSYHLTETPIASF